MPNRGTHFSHCSFCVFLSLYSDVVKQKLSLLNQWLVGNFKWKKWSSTDGTPANCALAQAFDSWSDVESQTAPDDITPTPRFSIEDLPEGIMRRSFRALANSCLCSAVKLGTTSKLLYFYFYTEVAEDDQLSDGLLQQQIDHEVNKLRWVDPRRQCLRGLKRMLFAVINPGAAVFVCALLLMVLATTDFTDEEGGFPTRIAGTALICYCVNLLLVVTVAAMTQLLGMPKDTILKIVTCVLVLPCASIIMLLATGLVNKESIKVKASDTWGSWSILPLVFLIGATISQFMATMSWVWAASVELTWGSKTMNMWHLMCEALLLTYNYYCLQDHQP